MIWRILTLKIEMLDQQTVKVILSQLDMEELSITYEELDYSRPDTRKIILQLLRRVREKTELDFTKGKLFIEAFPSQEGGCVLYLNLIEQTLSKNRHEFSTPLIFSFSNIEELSKLCNKLLTRYHHLILKSALYHHTEESKYILMIYSYYKLDDKLIAIVKEHGTLIGKGNIKKCIIDEHAKLIMKEQAIETVAKYLS